MDGTDHDSTDCKVLSTDANVALDTSEVVDYLKNATTLYRESTPPLFQQLNLKEEHYCYMIWGEMRQNGKTTRKS